MKTFLTLALMLLCVPVFAQEPTPLQSVVVQPPFEVRSITDKLLYRAESVETIIANDSAYLAFENPPVPVAAVLLEIQGNSISYIEVWKAGSGDLPVVLDEFAPGRYLFEHQGAGEYHVRSEAENGRPVYTKFTVKQGTDPPPIDPPPVDPPPGDHAALIKIIRDNKPNDQPTATALAAAYRQALRTMSSDAVNVSQAKEISEKARRDALLKLPPLQASWNVLFQAVATYTRPLAIKTEYMAALTVLANELSPVQTSIQNTSVPEVNWQPPARLFRTRVWVEQQCFSNGVCIPGHWEYR